MKQGGLVISHLSIVINYFPPQKYYPMILMNNILMILSQNPALSMTF